MPKLSFDAWPWFQELLAPLKRNFREVVAISFFTNCLALAVPIFTLQVYDRVIPARSEYTLIILSLGVLLSILIELGMKFARSHIMDYVIVGLDARLSREIFNRLLQLRVDQMPASVGSLAAQMRGYETVRGFFTSITTNFLVDMPFALLFLLTIGLIGGALALVPLPFL